MLPSTISYWTKDRKYKNFGDYLTETIYNRALVAPLVDAHVYRLIGSVIHKDNIQQDLDGCAADDRQNVVFWGCGMRNDAPLPDDVKEKCLFFGVRGPLTQKILDLPQNTTIGDPGLLMPLLHKPNTSHRTKGKTVCMPHYHQIKEAEELQKLCNADISLSPAVSGEEELNSLIDDIWSADFVLSGSLHGAILACAYGRPFAYWDTGFIDTPFKWQDFSASISIDSAFATNIDQGKELYNTLKNQIVLPKYSPMLIDCPFSVKMSVLMRAMRLDFGTEMSISERVADIIEKYTENQSRTKALSERNWKNTSKLIVSKQLFQKQLEVIQRSAIDVLAKSQKIFEPIEHKNEDHVEKMYFMQGEEGEKFLIDGWSVPQQDYGPWSLRPVARLRIDAQYGWAKAKKIVFHGLFFVPLIGHTAASRRIETWINRRYKFVNNVKNTTSAHTLWHYIDFDLSECEIDQEKDLEFVFLFEDVGTQAALGIDKTDDREVGFAPTYVEALF